MPRTFLKFRSLERFDKLLALAGSFLKVSNREAFTGEQFQSVLDKRSEQVQP